MQNGSYSNILDLAVKQKTQNRGNKRPGSNIPGFLISQFLHLLLQELDVEVRVHLVRHTLGCMTEYPLPGFLIHTAFHRLCRPRMPGLVR